MAKDKEQGPEEGEMGHSHSHLTPVGKDFDPWKFENDKPYDRSEIVTRSVDKLGHKETLHTPVTPAMYGQIGALVASRELAKYRTVQDFVRNAIYHQLHYDVERLSDDSVVKELKRWLDRELIQSRREYRQSEVQSMLAAVESTRTLFEACVNAEYWGGLQEALDEAEGELDLFPEPFRQRVSDLITSFRQRIPR